MLHFRLTGLLFHKHLIYWKKKQSIHFWCGRCVWYILLCPYTTFEFVSWSNLQHLFRIKCPDFLFDSTSVPLLTLEELCFTWSLVIDSGMITAFWPWPLHYEELPVTKTSCQEAFHTMDLRLPTGHGTRKNINQENIPSEKPRTFLSLIWTEILVAKRGDR